MPIKTFFLSFLTGKFLLVELSGGLGNQIFQLEMARSLVNSGSRKMIIDVSNIDSQQFGGKSTIESFLFQPDVLIIKYGQYIKKFTNTFKRYLKYLNRINQRFVLVLDEVGMGLNINEVGQLVQSRNSKFIVVFGYYQDFAYWSAPDNYELRNPGKVYSDLVRLNTEYRPIILHYRVGSFGTVWEYQWGILNPNYFDAALSLLNKNSSIRKNPIWVFSDNTHEVKNIIKDSHVLDKYSFNFIDDSELSPAELFILFSKSQYLICSNSTFSLAAAKVGNVPNVIAPANLSKYSRIMISMPERWNQLDSVWLDNTFHD